MDIAHTSHLFIHCTSTRTTKYHILDHNQDVSVHQMNWAGLPKELGEPHNWVNLPDYLPGEYLDEVHQGSLVLKNYIVRLNVHTKLNTVTGY